MGRDDEIVRPPADHHLTGDVLTVADIVQTEALQLTLRGGELLLTTGQPLHSGPAAYVERPAAAGLTGIGLEPVS